MSKKIILSVVLSVVAFFCNAGSLVYIDLERPIQSEFYRSLDGLTINYQTDRFIICTVENNKLSDYQTIDDDAWLDGVNYFLLWFDINKDQYISDFQSNGNIIFAKDNFVVVKTFDNTDIEYNKTNHLGVVAIQRNGNKEIIDRMPDYLSVLEEDSILISQLISQVNQDSLFSYVKHLQDYRSRKCNETSTIVAQEWLQSRFDALGYSTELQDVRNYPTKNVLATKIGTKYPDEYVVCGCHYDSYSYWGDCPGADDNATGTAGMLEIARVLSDYEFERTIVICTFTAEELGLYGSGAYASRCAGQDLNILGYFNIDMSGYLAEGNGICTYVIYPNKAKPLFDFYEATCSKYMPDFCVESGYLAGGDSDHTSFNQNGYMGIFPFEDPLHDSPYIHTNGDTIGVSVNSFEQVKAFTQATLANVVRMASAGFNPSGLDDDDVITADIYPNPANDYVTIDCDNMMKIVIYNDLGQIMNVVNPNSNKIVVDIKSYKTGVYFIYVQSFDGNHKMYKLVK